MPRVILADALGFCAGVKAIDHKVEQQLKNYSGPIYSYGPLVHNQDYIDQREAQGVHVLHSLEELSTLERPCCVISRAHGITKEERAVLESADCDFVDGTCPVLLQLYRIGEEANQAGWQVVIIGDPNHPEVRAMKSYYDPDTVVLETEAEAQAFVPSRPFLVLSQTTNRDDYFQQILRWIQDKGECRVEESRCRATQDRQEACWKLAQEVDAMLVIGGTQSSNTEKLRQTAAQECKSVLKIENYRQIPLQKYAFFNTIGITAGASTPSWIIEEVVESMENLSQEELMEQIEDSMVKIYPRDIVKGDVITVKDDEVYVDIHYIADGIIKSDEMTEEEQANPREFFHEGEEIDVYVIKLDDGEGNVALSTRRVEGLKNWQKLVEMSENDETVEAVVTGSNRGGLVVKVMGIAGFIPASQITTYFVKNFKQFMGQTLECKFLSMDERKRRVVLSSRAVQEKELDKVWEGIVVGQKVKGKVVRMTDFGAFIDLGGVDGLVHVSDISWSHVDKPSDVLEIGQEVEPVVLKANRERNRISLGLKQLAPKPFDLFVAENKPGDVVTGEVVNMVDFGAFVRLKEGVEGLVHVSQISNHHVEKPSDELNLGQEVTVKILSIEEDRQRIALSIRALEKPEKKEEAADEAQGETSSDKHYDESRFERKPRQDKQNQPRRERKPRQSAISFSADGDMGTNLGDLIAQQMNEANLTVDFAEEPETAEEAAEEPAQAPAAAEEQAEEHLEAGAEGVEEDAE